MISINLLPRPEKEQIKSKRFNLYLTSITTFVLFFVGLVILGLFFAKITLGNQTKNLDNTIEEKKKIYGQYDEEKNLVENFNSSVALAKQLITKEVIWSDILKDLEDATPAELRLSDFSFGSGNGKTSTTGLNTSTQINLSGYASDQRMIVKFIDKLEESNYFSEVKLVSATSEQSTSEEERETVKTYAFDITTTINEQGTNETD